MRNFLFFLSKTDLDIIKPCPRLVYMQQASLGLFVLLTGLFAWLSSTFAISTLFHEYDPYTGKASITVLNQSIAAIIGLLYTILIMAIDREIVSTSSKWSVAPRIVLAAIIGVVVAVPIELKILEDPLLKSIDQRNKKENSPLLAEEEHRISIFDVDIRQMRQQMQDSRNEAAKWSNIMEQEAKGTKLPDRSGQPGKGVRYDESERNYILWTGRIKCDSIDLLKLNQSRDSLVREARKKTVQQSSKASFGFYAMYKELQLMQEEDPTSATSKLSWGLCFLFMMIEITPAIVKLIRHKNEYDSALEARRRINISGVHKEGNDAMAGIAASNGAYDHPEYVDKMRARISK